MELLTVGIISLSVALIASLIYINNLKTDNDFLRSQLSSCRETMGNERQIQKNAIAKYQEYIAEIKNKLKLAENKCIAEIDLQPIQFERYEMKRIRGQMEILTKWSEAEKLLAVEDMKKSMIDLIWDLGKVEHYRKPYTRRDKVYHYEFWVADTSKESGLMYDY